MREHLPGLKIRVVNIVDLMKLQPQTEHPHGLSDRDFDQLFTKDKPVILERLVLAAPSRILSGSVPAIHVFLNREDIKVMGVRRGSAIELTRLSGAWPTPIDVSFARGMW